MRANLKIDYDHLLENTPFEDLEGMQRCNFLLKILLDLRRPTKEILDYYYVIDPVIDYLRKDKEFVRLLDEARIRLKQKSENHKDIGYYVRESNIVSREDFVLGERVDRYKQSLEQEDINLSNEIQKINNGGEIIG